VTYREIAPTAALASWVECFWTRSVDASVGMTRVLPDGCADFIFELRGGEAMAVGMMTKPFLFESHEPADLVGVRFRPGRAAAFLRIPLAELTDARVTLRDVWRDAPERITIPALEAALLQRLAPDRDPRVDAAVEKIIRGAGRIEEIAREIGISRQHLARQFQHHVGVSPKTFARLMRFRRLLSALPENPDWADVAAQHGYYDQAHLIDEFRELAGETPNAFHFSNRQPAPRD
jgi:AraC-like DNA-binding protein